MALQRATTVVRAWLPVALLTAFALVLLGRLVQLQIIHHSEYAAAARSELDGSATVYANRGSILDRNGNALAITIDTWDVYINKNAWTGAVASHADKLASLLAIPSTSITQTLTESKGINVRVASDVPHEAGAAIEAASIPGVTLDRNFARFYPEGDLAASALGLVGGDNVGLTGLENTYDSLLRGTPGRAFFERDTLGEPIPFGRFIAEEPKPGVDLVLTIDRQLQQLAEKALADAVRANQAVGGNVIIVDPWNGGVLAMASLPTLRFSTLDLDDESQLELLKISPVSDIYEPGSVMKTITAASAIDHGVITPNTTYVDQGSYHIADVTITNWEHNVYGQQTMTGVLQNSINTGSVFMVERLGEPEFHRYLDAFGFGHTTNIDLPGEAAGLVRTPDQPGYSRVDAFTQSFGQSIGVTPMQILAAYSAVINGGDLIQPHVVKGIIGEDAEYRELPVEVSGHPITAETSATMVQMLRSVIENGDYHPGRPKDFSAGGKSGTANVPGPNGGAYTDAQIASFVGFAPADKPAILVLVKLDRNRNFLTGTQAAAPVFAAIANEALHYLGVEADARRYAVAR